MNVIALNFGSPDRLTAAFLAEAVSAAKEAGADVTVIEMSDKKINRCLGCGACSDNVKDGKSNAPSCILKDDLKPITEAYMNADGILVAAPVCYLGPSGQLMDFVHRVCVAADKAVMNLREYQRQKKGEPSVDPRFLKQQWIGLISVGERMDEHAVSFGLPVMRTMAFSATLKHVGSLNIHGEMAPEEISEYKEKCRQLGTAMANALKSPDSATPYVGHKGHCPICHGDTFTLIPGTNKAECPLCGITGTLSLNDGEVCINYPEEAVFHSRINHGGVIDHCVELHGFEDYCMELYADKTWVEPRNLKEDLKQWIADGLIEAPPGWIQKEIGGAK